MGYVDSNLMDGEDVKYKAKVHWIIRSSKVFTSMRFHLFFLLSCLTTSSFALDFYIWHDENGKKHVSNLPRKCISPEKTIKFGCNKLIPLGTTKQYTDTKNEKELTSSKLELLDATLVTKKYVDPLIDQYKNLLEIEKEVYAEHEGKKVSPYINDYFTRFSRDVGNTLDVIESLNEAVDDIYAIYSDFESKEIDNLALGDNVSLKQFLESELEYIKEFSENLSSYINQLTAAGKKLKNIFFIGTLASQKTFDIKYSNMEEIKNNIDKLSEERKYKYKTYYPIIYSSSE